jgi:hypothetical protein
VLCNFSLFLHSVDIEEIYNRNCNTLQNIEAALCLKILTNKDYITSCTFHIVSPPLPFSSHMKKLDYMDLDLCGHNKMTEKYLTGANSIPNLLINTSQLVIFKTKSYSLQLAGHLCPFLTIWQDNL